jgi:hypothetical protein
MLTKTLRSCSRRELQMASHALAARLAGILRSAGVHSAACSFDACSFPHARTACP